MGRSEIIGGEEISMERWAVTQELEGRERGTDLAAICKWIHISRRMHRLFYLHVKLSSTQDFK